MCGRLAQATAPWKVQEFVPVTHELHRKPHYNLAPAQRLAALRQASNRSLVWALLKWGLVPAWAKTPRTAYKMINAKAETLAEKSAFRAAYRHRRCIIPADGFYEWRQENQRKQPYFIHYHDNSPLFLAGLWETWQNAGQTLETCAIVTTVANAQIRPLHSRMPLIFSWEQAERWLDCTPHSDDELKSLLCCIPDRPLVIDPVSTRVNKPSFDEPACFQPDPAGSAGDEKPGFQIGDRRQGT